MCWGNEHESVLKLWVFSRTRHSGFVKPRSGFEVVFQHPALKLSSCLELVSNVRSLVEVQSTKHYIGKQSSSLLL